MNNVEFLLTYSPDSIQFRVKKVLLGEFDITLYNKVKESKVYQQYLNNLISREKNHDFYGVHGATDIHLENAIVNLRDLGIDISDPEVKKALDDRIEPIRNRSINEHYCFDQFAEIILFPLLYKIGYRDEWLIQYLNRRLEFVYQFCREKNYDIYMDKTHLRNIPKCWRNDGVISPIYYSNGDFQFPLIYDIVYYHEIYQEGNRAIKDKINTIIDYVTSSDYYTKIQTSYGILIRNLNEEKPSRYMKMGWDCKIHGFYNFNGDSFDKRRLLKRLELFAVFDRFRVNEYFNKWLKFFNEYNTEYGTYILPDEFIKLKGTNMYDQRIKKDLLMEIESTYAIENIKRLSRI